MREKAEMNSNRFSRHAKACLVIALLVCGVSLRAHPAPGPASTLLGQTFQPGQRRIYTIRIISRISSGTPGAVQHSKLVNQSRVSLRVMAVSAAGARIRLRYLRYSTRVRGNGPMADQLQQQAISSDPKVLKMAPLVVQVSPEGKTQIISQPQSPGQAQALNVLIQLVRDNYFPAHAVAADAVWSRHRTQSIGIGHARIPLRFHYHLLHWNPAPDSAMLIRVRTTGHTTLPVSMVPNYQHLTELGFALQPTFRLTGTSVNRYRSSDCALLSSHSQSQTTITVKMIRGLAPPRILSTQMNSTGSVRLLSPSNH